MQSDGRPTVDQGAVGSTAWLVDGSAVTQPVSGTITANAGTNLNTSLLALEAGGNLAAVATSLAIVDDWDESDRAKVNPIAGQAGVQGASGIVTALTQRVVLATDVALPTGANAIGKLAANDGVDIGDVTINNASLAVTGTFWQATQPVSGTVSITANSAVNVAQINGVTPLMGNGASGTGALRVTLANDSTGIVALTTGSASIGVLGANSGVDIGDVTINNASLAVTGTFWQATQPVSGTVAVTSADITTLAGTVRAEDVASADAHTGIPTLAVQKATPANTADTDGDYEFLQMSVGRLWTSAVLTAGSASIGILGANSGVDIGDVTVNNASGGSAVNIQDGGNSITVDGTFWQATQPVSGTFWQATQPVSGTFWQATQPVSGTVAVTNSDLTTIAGAVRAEDAASADGHTGIPTLAVQKATPANTGGTDGDYEFLQMSAGRLWTSAVLTAGSASIGTLGANSGVDIGDVTINNAAGASAVNIQDGGNSITIDGTVAFSNTTIAVTNAGTFAIQDSEKIADNAGFTDGTTKLTPGGFIYDEVAGTALTENDIAAARINLNRAQVGIIEDGATRGRWATVTAANALKVDASGVAIPLAAGSASIGILGANSGVDIGDVTINNASGASAVNIQDGGNSITVDGTLAVTNADITTVAGAVRAEDAASADAHTGIGALAVRKATPANTSGTDGDYEFLQMSVGRLWTSATIDAALPAGTNAIGKLAANSGVDIGDVDVMSIVPGVAATNLGKAEDAVHTTGDTGVMALGVRNDAGAVTFGADGDYIPFATDANGRIGIADLGGTITVDGTVNTVPGIGASSIVTGTLTSAANGTALNTEGTELASVIVTNTFVATWKIEVSYDNAATYSTAVSTDAAYPSADKVIWNNATSGFTTGKTVLIDTAGATHIRVVTTAYTSGTLTYRLAALPSARASTQQTHLYSIGSVHQTVSTNNGTADAGSQRVVVASNNTPFFIKPTGADGTGLHTAANPIYTRLTDGTTALNSGNGTAATALRVTLANDSTGIVALTTSTASIGKLAANTGVIIGDVNVVSNIPGVAATSLGKAEDAVHTTGDVGVMALAVQKNVSASVAADGDYHPLQTDSRGQLHVAVPKAATVVDVTLASSATSAQLIAANTARTGMMVTNTDSFDCYLYYGTTAIATKFTVVIPPGGYWEMPTPIYTGRIDVIWEVDGSGSLIGVEMAN